MQSSIELLLYHLALSPGNGDVDGELARDTIDGNESWLLGGGDVALGVHVHDGSGAAALGPGGHIGGSREGEGSLAGAGEVDRILGRASNAREVECVGAETLGTLGDLSETLHVGGEGSELEALIESEVDGELAVAAPLRGLGAGAGLDDVLGEGDFEEGLGGVDLNIGGARRAARAEEGDTHHTDGGRSHGSGGIERWLVGDGRSGNKASEEGDDREGLHFGRRYEDIDVGIEP